jgi:hypothetical protein
MKCYKLTDANGMTRGSTQWGENVTHTAGGNGKRLCSDGWIHFYTDPLIATVLNPGHANFGDAQLWEAESSGEELHEALKSGSRSLTTIRRIDSPVISIVQKIAFSILCTKEVCNSNYWNTWADNWLTGVDRTYASARAAYDTAYTCVTSTYAASYDYAAFHAIYAARAADAAAAAYAASYAADANKQIDFVSLVKRAMTYK